MHPVSEPGTQQALLKFVAITVMTCLFIQPIFLEPQLGAQDTGRSKVQKLMPCGVHSLVGRQRINQTNESLYGPLVMGETEKG